jgi:curved DNA-binding protein CbpA
MEDPHQILGIAPGTDPETARKAFLRKAREWHPDVSNLDPALAHDMFQRLNAAYDQFRARPQTVNQPSPEPPMFRFSTHTFEAYRKRMKKSRQYGTYTRRSRGRKTISLGVFGSGR